MIILNLMKVKVYCAFGHSKHLLGMVWLPLGFDICLALSWGGNCYGLQFKDLNTWNACAPNTHGTGELIFILVLFLISVQISPSLLEDCFFFSKILKMEETYLPPEKRARLENIGAHSFRDVLLSPSIDEEDGHIDDENEMSLLTAVDTLKSFVQQIMSRKESDYIHLELEYGSTLESLEEYKQNSENARKKIAALEEELNEATMKLDEKDSEIENAKEKLFNFGNETRELVLKKEERLKNLELLLRESNNEIRNLDQKNKQLMEENKQLKEEKEENEVKISKLRESLSKKNELPKEVVVKMSEMEKKILEFNKNEEKKNFFVFHNEEDNHLSFRLSEKEEELRNLELSNKDALNEIEKKDHKIKDMDEELLKKNLDIQRLKSRSEKMFNMLREKDNNTAKLKEDFRKHFVVLSQRVAVLEKQKPIFDTKVTQILSSLKPIEPFSSKLQNIPSVNIKLSEEPLNLEN